jgi:uncharacterized protein (DUF1684 family)
MSTSTLASDFATDWAIWHDEHERRRAAPRGFLAAIGLYWLSSTPVRVAEVPGAWSLEDDAVTVDLAEGEVLRDGDKELRGTVTLRGNAALSFTAPDGTEGSAEVGRRGSGVILRPRLASTPYLEQYSGTPTYPADERWRVPAQLEPFDSPRPTNVGSVVEGLEHVFSSPGTLVFELGGTEHRLTAFDGGADGSLTVLFRDATSGVTTYAANRSLSVPAPAADGSTILDFNRATNLPCANTDFATCPLPPRENTLDLAVQAGEKTPRSRVS